jgi:hypothetical protein
MAIAFSKSKYVSASELADFSNMLEQTILQLQNKLNITPYNKKHSTVVIELWPLVHHVTCGEYLRYAPSQQQINLWIGLDLIEDGIALVIWLDEPIPAVINKLFAIRNNGCCGEFGCYQRGKINQAWIALNDTVFDQFLKNSAQQQQIIIEDFLNTVLQGIK